MHGIWKYFATILLMMFIICESYAQETGLRSQSVSLFIDCEFCDIDHIKREILWVNFAIEPKEADIHLLVVSERTGAGGSKVSLFFIGQNKFYGQNDTLTYVNLPDDTHDTTRDRMIGKIKVGLMSYIKQTPLAEYITVDVLIPNETEEVVDKWNNWVFEISASGSANGRKGYNNFSIWSSVEAERVTEKSRIETSFDQSYSESNFDYDDYKYKSFNRSLSFSQENVFAISDHWSVGVWAGCFSSTRSNLKFKYYLTPAIEYNIFPYEESTRRQLRIYYDIGLNRHWYNDTTIYYKTQELVWDQSLSIDAEFVHQWGRISFYTSYSNYMHDFSLNRISMNTNLRLRIAKGLEFNVRAGYAIIHNQIELPKGDATQEEVLLQQRELKTDYSFWGNVGLSYTFGSLYNNVVNPRFGN